MEEKGISGDSPTVLFLLSIHISTLHSEDAIAAWGVSPPRSKHRKLKTRDLLSDLRCPVSKWDIARACRSLAAAVKGLQLLWSMASVPPVLLFADICTGHNREWKMKTDIFFPWGSSDMEAVQSSPDVTSAALADHWFSSGNTHSLGDHGEIKAIRSTEGLTSNIEYVEWSLYSPRNRERFKYLLPYSWWVSQWGA